MMGKEITEISLADIMPNRFQPREIFDEQALNELALSIREHGVIQPITVRKVGDKYEIIAGERRYRASKIAGVTTIPAIIREIDDKEAAKIALLENLQRQDLTPIEEAKTYQTILKLENITQEELANNLGKAQSTVANKIRLLNLDEEVQTALLNNQISERHARSLLNITDKQEQKRLLEKIIVNRMTVKQLDEEIANLSGKTKEPLEEEKKTANYDRSIFDRLRVDNTEEKQEIKEKEDIKIPVEPILPPTEEIKPVEEKIVNEEEHEVENDNQIPEQPIVKAKEQIQDNQKEEKKENIPSNNMNYNIPDYNNAYDLRFAINNVRQVIQNTKKFGFNIDMEEFDFENIYQIVIKIDKNN